jgi:hypothetical protein
MRKMLILFKNSSDFRSSAVDNSPKLSAAVRNLKVGGRELITERRYSLKQ